MVEGSVAFSTLFVLATIPYPFLSSTVSRIHSLRPAVRFHDQNHSRGSNAHPHRSVPIRSRHLNSPTQRTPGPDI